MTDSIEMFRGFVCGTIAGWTQVFVMQPFEIIKVRLVNQSLLKPEYFGIVDCFKRILKEEEIHAFYRGRFRFTQALFLPLLDTAYRDLLPLGPTNFSKSSSPTSTGNKTIIKTK